MSSNSFLCRSSSNPTNWSISRELHAWVWMLPNPGAYTGVKRQLALSSNACALSSRVLLDEPESWNLWGSYRAIVLIFGRGPRGWKLSVAAQPALLKFLNRVPKNRGAKIVYSIYMYVKYPVHPSISVHRSLPLWMSPPLPSLPFPANR